MQADLLQFYGVDLLDIGTPALSWRRAGVLIRQLPREARLTQELHPAQRWSQTDYLLALVADLLNLANWQRASAGRRSALPRPKPLRRPGESQGRTFGNRKFTPAQLRRRLKMDSRR